MQFKEKDVFIFFLEILIDITKCGTVFSHDSKSLCVVVLFTPALIIFVVCCVEMVTKRL